MSYFQGSDQVTCIIQDGNVVWSAAVPRCEGEHTYKLLCEQWVITENVARSRI